MTTFVATTAEGNTVARTSATKDYNFVILAKTHIGQRASNVTAEQDATEGAWGWSADRNNAEKTAQQARKVYTSVRVVEVEDKLTGKAAKLVLDAIKSAPAKGSGSPYVGTNTNTMGTLPTAETAPVEVEEKEIAVPTKSRAKKAAEKIAAPVVEEAPVKVEFDSTDFVALLAEVAEAQRVLADKLAERNAMIDHLIKSGECSGPKLAAIMGVTPMAVYNMAKKAA